MSPLLVQRPRGPDDDWFQLLVLAVLFGMPILGRILKALLNLGKAAPDRPAPSRPRPARPAADEDTGEDLWRRLLRGEELPAPRPRPVRSPEPTPEPEPPAPERAAPLSLMEELGETGEVLVSSLETEIEPTGVDVLAQEARAAAPHPAVGRLLDRRGLRHAILASEILGPPVSLRRH